MNPLEALIPMSILGTFGLTLYFFTKVITDYILRKRMIEKGFVNGENQAIFKESREMNKYSSLKWGLLVLSGGVALVLIDAFDVEPDSALPYGIFAIALSIGFLAYYFIIRKEVK